MEYIKYFIWVLLGLELIAGLIIEIMLLINVKRKTIRAIEALGVMSMYFTLPAVTIALYELIKTISEVLA